MNINDLDYECLENIFIHLNPYSDLLNCSLVCKLWHATTKSASVYIKRNFENGLINNNLICKDLSADVTARHSHASCLVDDYMYIFGGCSSGTTFFNDLWQLSLSTHIWTRTIASGSFPQPKSKASMLLHENHLIVYGGLIQTSHRFGGQKYLLFNEVHAYNLDTKIWSRLVDEGPDGPKSAGHSASIIGDSMIVFGGLRDGYPILLSSNELWIYSLTNHTWKLINCEGPVPRARFSHSQVVIDPQNILILGGCDGDFLNCIWRLKLVGTKESPDEFLEHSHWIPIIVRPSNDGHSMQPFIHVNPVVKMGNKILVLNSARLTALSNSVPFTLRTIDTSTLFTAGCVSWLPTQSNSLFSAPENLMMYSLALARSEMILFGGFFYRGLQRPSDCVVLKRFLVLRARALAR